MLYIFISILIIYFIMPSKKIKFGIIKFKNYIIPLTIIALLIFLVIFSKDVFNSAHNGLLLWCNNVIPSLFPFLICIEILKKTNIIHIIGKILEHIIRPIFNIPGSGAFAVVMGMCSGYPIGAKIAASLREKNQCSVVEGERLLAFTNTSGPLFIVGAVGIGMFSDSKIGFLLLITHFIAALLVGIVFRFYKYKVNYNRQTPLNAQHNVYLGVSNNKSKDYSSFPYKKNIEEITSEENKSSETIKLSQLGSIMSEAIKNSISTLLLICGFIVFFCVLGTILDDSGITNAVSTFISKLFIFLGFSHQLANELSIGFFKGILEITSGLKVMANISLSYNVILPLVATILGFGGISVHMQVASIISNTDLSIKPYLVGKVLHGLFAGIITYFTLNYTNLFNLETVETFSTIVANNIKTNEVFGFLGSGNILIMSLSVILIISLFLLLFKKHIHTI